MKEQVVQRVGNRSGLGDKARSVATRQQQTKRGSKSASLATRLRSIVAYVPVALKIGLAIAVVALVFFGYRAAASASFFQVRHIQTRGTNRASTQSIEATIRRDVAERGVWRADLRDLSAHLEQLPWVRTAIVTRVLPDGIRVRITEREPKAVVRTSEGKFLWVDEDAVSLGEMSSSDQMPTFFLRGWNEDASSAARQENKERVKKFLELQRVWDAEGVSERVSEVNLQDLGDVRAQLSGDDAEVEIRLGAEDQGKRLKPALATLDKLRQTPQGPYISYLIVSLPKRVLVGLVSGRQALADAMDLSADAPAVVPAKSESNTRKKEEPRSDRQKKDGATRVRNQEKKTDQKRG